MVRNFRSRRGSDAPGRLGAPDEVSIGEPGASAWPADGGTGLPRQGVGQALIERAIKDAAAKGHSLVILVGDEPYYRKCGFKPLPPGRVFMPGPVDPGRLLVAELKPAPRRLKRRGAGGLNRGKRRKPASAAFARPGSGETAEQQQQADQAGEDR